MDEAVSDLGDGRPPAFDAGFRSRLRDLLVWRRDVRRFRTDPVAEHEMQALLQAACLAPSVGNAQPWRFVRVRSSGLRDALVSHVEAENRAAAARYAGDELELYLSLKLHGLREAPEILAIFCDDQAVAGRGLGARTMPETLRYSTVLATYNLWLSARARGIGVGWVSILEPSIIAGLLDVPGCWCLIGVLCIGYPQEEHDVPELQRAGWQDRLDHGDFVIER